MDQDKPASLSENENLKCCKWWKNSVNIIDIAVRKILSLKYAYKIIT